MAIKHFRIGALDDDRIWFGYYKYSSCGTSVSIRDQNLIGIWGEISYYPAVGSMRPFVGIRSSPSDDIECNGTIVTSGAFAVLYGFPKEKQFRLSDIVGTGNDATK
jgi:hypothetical protein